jgi:hypothetical protein
VEKKMLNHEIKVWMPVMAIERGKNVWHTIKVKHALINDIYWAN